MKAISCNQRNGGHRKALWSPTVPALYKCLGMEMQASPLPFTPYFFLVVQSTSPIRLFSTPWTAAVQASLPLTISWSLPKFMSIELVMPSNQIILWSLHTFLYSTTIQAPGTRLEVAKLRSTWPLGILCGPLGKGSGEGNGPPLQYSCLENPMDGGAW